MDKELRALLDNEIYEAEEREREIDEIIKKQNKTIIEERMEEYENRKNKRK